MMALDVNNFKAFTFFFFSLSTKVAKTAKGGEKNQDDQVHLKQVMCPQENIQTLGHKDRKQQSRHNSREHRVETPHAVCLLFVGPITFGPFIRVVVEPGAASR